ncbi:hypothetical protein JCM10213_000271 [Rhodosporidiobolus nylandii]
MGVDLDRFVNKPDDGLCCPGSRCTNADSGCAWEGSISNEAAHLPQCLYRPMICSDCATVYPLAEHEEHLQICPAVEILCPRGGANCGGVNLGRYRRRDAAQHEAKCTMFRRVITNLPYHENYCTATRTRLADKEAEVQALNGSLHSAREAGVQAQTRIDGLEHALKEKDERLAHKEAEVRALNGSLHSAREAGVQVQARIDGLEHALEEKDKAVEHSDRQLKAKDREIQRLRRIIVADNDPPRPKPNTRTGGSDGNRLPEGQPAMDVEPHPSGSNKRWSRDPVPSVPAAPFSDPHGYSPNRRPQAKRSKLRAFADDE